MMLCNRIILCSRSANAVILHQSSSSIMTQNWKYFSSTKGTGVNHSASTIGNNKRLSSAGINWKSDGVLEHKAVLVSHMKARNSQSEDVFTSIDRMSVLEQQRRQLSANYENLVVTKKTIGKEVADAKKAMKSKQQQQEQSMTDSDADPGDSSAMIRELMQRGETNRSLLNEALLALEHVEEELSHLFSHFPNLLDDLVPDGGGSAENHIVATHFEDQRLVTTISSNVIESQNKQTQTQTQKKEGYLHHDEIAKLNGWMDLDAANRMSGTRFNILTGNLARFERDLTRYFLDFHTKQRSATSDSSSSSSSSTAGGGGGGASQRSGGYSEVSVPYIVSEETLQCTGHLPKFKDDLFGINHAVKGQSAYLIPTAEVPITSMFMHQVLDSRDLPLRFVANTPSFRAEAGAYGKDTRGIMRQHQFHKVELVTIATPETSSMLHEEMVDDVEALIQTLELPYRKALLCSGDTGFAASVCYDIECWFPGQQAYREVSSISNCTDFQSKRLGFIGTDNAFNVSRLDRRANGIYPHTINGSGLAIGRALAAILENYQNPDGSVRLPTELIPYCPKGWNGIIPSNNIIKKNTIRLNAKR